MAVSTGILISVLSVTLQVLFAPTVAEVDPNLPFRTSFVANPVSFIHNLPEMNVVLTCTFTDTNAARTVNFDGLLIQKKINTTTGVSCVDYASIRVGNAVPGVLQTGITATGNIVGGATGSTLTVTLPASAAASHVGVYQCIDIERIQSNEPTNIPYVDVRERPLNMTELTDLFLQDRNTCNCGPNLTALEERIAALENATTDPNSLLNQLNSTVSRELTTSNWPAGIYALLKPETGCPNDPAFRNRQSSYVSFVSEITPNAEVNGAYNNSHLSTPVFTRLRQTSEQLGYLRFCPTNNDLSTGAWPTGAYCFNRAGTTCPMFFAPGSLRLSSETSVFPLQSNGGPGTTFNTINFCCRNDNPASTPITLPTDSPFYLYPVGLNCQTVTGMTSTVEFFDFDTDDTTNNNLRTGATPFHLFRGTSLHLWLCHYTATVA